MIVYKPKRALLLKVRDTDRITNLIPTAKVIQHKGSDIVAVPHRIDEVRVLRNLGFNAPGPIKYHYKWSGSYAPFYAQSETADFLTTAGNAFVLNDLGTGKTLSTLWAFDYLRQQGVAAKALVVTPLSTLERAWGDEIFTHFPHLNFAVLHGTRDKRLKLLNTDADLYLINHDGIKTAGFLDAMALRPDINIIIVDEIAQIARNAQADRWKALNALCNKQFPRRVWGLTGTPTPNLPTDAWAQCRIINPGTVPPYFNRFRDTVMRQIGTYAWMPRDNATEVVESVMQPAIRFTRDDCVDLPPCIYQTREVSLTPEQSKAYNEMLRHLHAEAEEGEILAVNEAVKASKLVQIACGTVYAQDGTEVHFPATNRLQVIKEIVEEAGTKVIIFVPFVSSVEQVASFLEKEFSPASHVTHQLSGKGREFVGVIHGGIKKTDRDDIFSGFQKGKTPQVIVAQPAAMSHGLTLTAASTIVWYAPVTSNEVYEQANGRITRPGQKHTQFIINIEGTPIERKMYNRLRNKQAMQGLLLDMVAAKQTA